MKTVVVKRNSEEYFKLKEELLAKGYGCDVWTRHDEVWSGRKDGKIRQVKISIYG